MSIPSNFSSLESSHIKSEIDKWVKQIASECEASAIHYCNGSQEEYDYLCEMLVKKGTFIKLDPVKRPNSFACFSDPSDVARVEDKTFICSRLSEDAGPTNNWMAPDEMKKILNNLLMGSMKGRTLYVIPFCMGPLGSPLSRYNRFRVCGSEYAHNDPHG